MSLFRPALPWLLLAVSLATNAWLALRPSAPPSAEVGIVRSASPARPLAPLPSPPAATTHPPDNTSASLTAPVTALPTTAAQVATYTAYADILARSLETAEQHDDLARVLGRWIASDPASASDWLNRQPDDPRYDLPVSQVAVHLTARGDYALAREWADSIRTPEVRVAAIEEILAERYRHRQLTPAALSTAAAAAGIPAARVQGILNYSRLD